MKRKCDVCNTMYDIDPRNFNRGWGLCCNKTCAAIKREHGKAVIRRSPLQLKKKRDKVDRELAEAEKANEHLGATEGLTFNGSRI